MSALGEHDRDTRDNADAYAILDDLPVRALDECEVCGAHECRHYCGFCAVQRPCPCDQDAAFHADRRALYRGEGGAKTRPAAPITESEAA